MSIEELVQILVKNSISSKNQSEKLEDVILKISTQREDMEYERMMQSTEEKE